MDKGKNLLSDRVEENEANNTAAGCDSFSITKEISRSNHYPMLLSKIDEEDESRIKSSSSSEGDYTKKTGDEKESDNKPAKSPHVMWKSEDEIIHISDNKRASTRQRPKSANCVVGSKPAMENLVGKKGNDTCTGHRKSALKTSGNGKNSDSESNSESSLISVLGRPRSAGSKPRNSKRFFSVWNEECSWDSARPRSACGMILNYLDDEFCCNNGDNRLTELGCWMTCDSISGTFRPKRSRSNPNMTKVNGRTKSNPDLQILQVDRFKRSLRLLGFQATDFGIFNNESYGTKNRRSHGKTKRVESAISTKLVRRSISLDGLREVVKEASLDDKLDSSHRKLLAKAAYEEWYFRKTEEARRRMADEKIKNKEIKEKLEDELECRKKKAEEQFRKWMEGKKAKMKIEKNKNKSASQQFKMVKTREEVEVAYRRWKKEKEKQRKERSKDELAEKEKESQMERQKEEKRALAERAFKEWKRKLEETEKIATEAKLRKGKTEMEKMKKERKISFQTWKNMKDKELMMKREEDRLAVRICREQRERRGYEAKEAFRQWMEKICVREKSIRNSKIAS